MNNAITDHYLEELNFYLEMHRQHFIKIGDSPIWLHLLDFPNAYLASDGESGMKEIYVASEALPLDDPRDDVEHNQINGIISAFALSALGALATEEHRACRSLMGMSNHEIPIYLSVSNNCAERNPDWPGYDLFDGDLSQFRHCRSIEPSWDEENSRLLIHLKFGVLLAKGEESPA
jgi:predicted glutamine amidotransferase